MRIDNSNSQTKGVMLNQTRHQKILRKHLTAAGGTVEFNTSLIGLVQDDDGVVAEITKTAADGEQITEKCKYAYVIGADGARSKFSFSSTQVVRSHPSPLSRYCAENRWNKLYWRISRGCFCPSGCPARRGS